MVKRILAIDIGNTAATVGFYEGGRLISFSSMIYDAIPKYARRLIRSGDKNHLDVIISSVFPKKSDSIKNKLKNIIGLKIWVAGNTLPVKIRHNYNNYGQLGIDRKVNAYGAAKMYQLPILVIDYGTAVTLDYIDAKGCFCGGMIVPGPETAYTALSQKASQLPKGLPFPSETKCFTGRNTRECMESGILEGYGAMTDELILRFRRRYGKNLRVLATGGLATTIFPYTSQIDTVDPKHSVKSLLALWRESRD